MANWNNEIFTIYQVHPSDMPMYRLIDDLDEVLDGAFYEPELQKVSVSADKVYCVECNAQGGQTNGGFGEMVRLNLQIQQLDRCQSPRPLKTSCASVVFSFER